MFDETLYTLQIQDKGKTITFKSYREFLRRLRGSENNVSVKITLHILSKDEVKHIESPWIIIGRDFYLKQIGEKLIKEPNYDNSDPDLGLYALRDAIEGVNLTCSDKSLKAEINPDHMKVLAFFIAEAARFEIVEHVCYVLFNDSNCIVHWIDWAPILKNWQKLSKFAIPHMTIPGACITPIGIDVTQANIYDLRYSKSESLNALNKLHEEFEILYTAIDDKAFNPSENNNNETSSVSDNNNNAIDNTPTTSAVTKQGSKQSAPVTTAPSASFYTNTSGKPPANSEEPKSANSNPLPPPGM